MKLIFDIFGEGEVVVKVWGVLVIVVQESVFVGVWWLNGIGINVLEVGLIFVSVIKDFYVLVRQGQLEMIFLGFGVINVFVLLVEFQDKLVSFGLGLELYVINLFFLLYMEEDLVWLDLVLGEGVVIIFFCGYGNCCIIVIGLVYVWWVQFFNLMDILIFDMFEVIDVLEVVLVVLEDLIDSGVWIFKVLEVIL